MSSKQAGVSYFTILHDLAWEQPTSHQTVKRFHWMCLLAEIDVLIKSCATSAGKLLSWSIFLIFLQASSLQLH